MAKYVKDPWAARNSYVRVLLNRSDEVRQEFLAVHALRPLKPADEIAVWKLLELQRHAMLMYTSCGWFFNELSGIETVQVIRHAGRALQLAHDSLGENLEPEFLELLGRAKSNLPEHRDGRRIYERIVKPAAVDWEKVAAHYAMSSLFGEEPQQQRAGVHCYLVDRQDYRALEVGKAKLVVGRGRVTSTVTRES